MNNRLTLNEVFDVSAPPKTQVIVPRTPRTVPIVQTDLSEKLDGVEKAVIENFNDLIDQGNEAIEKMNDVAQSSESARDFEVLSDMIKTVADVNMQIIDTIDKIERIKTRRDGGTKQPAQSVTNQTAVFVGTTKELNAILNNMNSGGIIDHE